MVVRQLNLPVVLIAGAADAPAFAIARTHGGQAMVALTTPGTRTRDGKLA